MKQLLIKTGASVTKRLTLMFVLLFASYSVHAQASSAETTETVFSNPMFLVLISIIGFLLIIIAVLGGVIKNLGGVAGLTKKMSGSAKAIATIVACTFMFNTANAASWNYGGITAPTFYMLIAIIVFEVFIVGVMINIIYMLLRKESVKKEAEAAVKEEVSFLERFNASVAIEEEEEILFDHEYDGIRELDNDLPPWWKYGFYVTIVVGLVYLVHYHVFRTGSLQAEEYTMEVKEAERRVAEYRANAANLVDETNVTVLTDETSLEKGKEVFKNCFACHGSNGEGGVGPNLTDEYWLYGGSIKDIFKIIKYGTEKGMKSWKDELSALQMSQVASYVHALAGTNPPNGKAPEGEIYKEELSIIENADSMNVEATEIDSTATPVELVDSTASAMSE